jgi:hypothetical protein
MSNFTMLPKQQPERDAIAISAPRVTVSYAARQLYLALPSIKADFSRRSSGSITMAARNSCEHRGSRFPDLTQGQQLT